MERLINNKTYIKTRQSHTIQQDRTWSRRIYEQENEFFCQLLQHLKVQWIILDFYRERG
jgi:hypothetical protein